MMRTEKGSGIFGDQRTELSSNGSLNGQKESPTGLLGRDGQCTSGNFQS